MMGNVPFVATRARCGQFEHRSGTKEPILKRQTVRAASVAEGETMSLSRTFFWRLVCQLAILSVLFQLCGSSLEAQQARHERPTDKQRLEILLKRVDQLEARVRQLE